MTKIMEKLATNSRLGARTRRQSARPRSAAEMPVTADR
jgi:hypothetical protein